MQYDGRGHALNSYSATIASIGLAVVTSNSMIHGTGRSLEVDIDVLKQLIEEDPRSTTRCLAERLECSLTTVETYLSELGKTWIYGVWIPHELSPHQLQLKVDICMALMTFHHNCQWLHNLITGDEKWVLYVNHTRNVNAWKPDKQV